MTSSNREPVSERVEPHDVAWAADFLVEAALVRNALGDVLVELHHIGSTAVPDLLAKPIIDMIGGVISLSVLDVHSDELTSLGYEAMGAFGIEGRRYFRKHNAEGRRTHHLHLYEAGSPEIERHIRFRDYLRAHPNRARDYSDLKAAIVSGEAGEGAPYAQAKSPLVQILKAEALDWAIRTGRATAGVDRR